MAPVPLPLDPMPLHPMDLDPMDFVPDGLGPDGFGFGRPPAPAQPGLAAPFFKGINSDIQGITTLTEQY